MSANVEGEPEIEKFVKARYPGALQEVIRQNIGEELPFLSIYEKTLVYEYTNEGYENLNETLWAGKESEFERYLNAVLDKLPDYVGVVHRGTVLTKNEVERYILAFEQNSLITEPAFTSASKSILTAGVFSKGKVLFQIFSKSGKEIDTLSFYGRRSEQDEKEVLFKSKTQFLVGEVRVEGEKIFITLVE